MVQSVEFDLRQAVLVNGPFGPKEVRHMEAAIIRDRTNYAILRDAVGGVAGQGRANPGQHGPAGGLPLPVGPLLSGHRGPQAGRRRGHGPLLPGQVATSPASSTTRAVESYQAAEKAGYDAGQCALGRAEALRYAGKPADGPGRAGQPLRRRRADGRVPRTSAAPPWPPWAAIPAKSWPCTSGPSRSIATIPAPCSAWPWKTIATATTRWPWNSTSGPPPASPPTSAR